MSVNCQQASILSQRVKVYNQEMASLKAAALEVDAIRQKNEKIMAKSAFDAKREKMVESLQKEISDLKDQTSQKINIKELEN